MTRDEMIDESVRRVKGTRKWRLIGDIDQYILVYPWFPGDEKRVLLNEIRAEFRRLNYVYGP